MSILGTPLNFDATPTQALTWTLESGSTGVIIEVGHEQGNNTRQISALSLGSVSATRKGYKVHGASTTYAYVEVWYITSSLGSIGSNPTITITAASGGTTAYSGTIFCVDGIDTNSANWTEANDGKSTDTAMQLTLSTSTNSIVIGGGACTVSSNSYTTTVSAANIEVASSDRNIGTASRVVAFTTTASGSSVVVDCDNADSSATRYQALYAVGIPPTPTSPTISSTSDDTPTDGSSLTLTVLNAGASQGAGSVTLAGVAQTVTAWSNTSITITIALGNNKYGVNASLVLNTDGGQSSSGYNVQVQPASGKSYTNLSGTLATTGNRIEAVADLASGDQVEVSNVVGGTISDVTLNVDASFSCSVGVTSFDVRANDGTWGSIATQYVSGPGSAQLRYGVVRYAVRSIASSPVSSPVGGE